MPAEGLGHTAFIGGRRSVPVTLPLRSNTSPRGVAASATCRATSLCRGAESDGLGGGSAASRLWGHGRTERGDRCAASGSRRTPRGPLRLGGRTRRAATWMSSRTQSQGRGPYPAAASTTARTCATPYAVRCTRRPVSTSSRGRDRMPALHPLHWCARRRAWSRTTHGACPTKLRPCLSYVVERRRLDLAAWIPLAAVRRATAPPGMPGAGRTRPAGSRTSPPRLAAWAPRKHGRSCAPPARRRPRRGVARALRDAGVGDVDDSTLARRCILRRVAVPGDAQVVVRPRHVESSARLGRGAGRRVRRSPCGRQLDRRERRGHGHRGRHLQAPEPGPPGRP